MNKIKSFFEKHPKTSYLSNLIIFIACVSVTSYFMPNFIGFVIGLLLSTVVINLLGTKWIPELQLFKSKKNNK
ncbi:hypothetical protein PDN41_31090 [Bacillus cereus]|uniref:hypothetical protein n=1 Tax=Bacillus wiedmannii TaxID=1890302 RepID=UPI0028532609|nr:hypothetical protein [Bacillus wiedmannii]MDA2386014.1 hypothetical protein [Bacillus cereus]MDR4943006.1 hypothetical protein [Bacillus wiedmannii]